MEFVFDSASAVTTIPVAQATKVGLLIPQKRIALSIASVSGEIRQLRRPARIQGRIQSPSGWDFDWPCHFLEGNGLGVNILGLAGVLDDLRVTLDSTYSLEAPHGWLILERR